MSWNPFQGAQQSYGSVTNPQLAQNQTTAIYQQQANQQAFNQLAQQQAQRQMMDWVFDGTPMTVMEFADEIWPEPCAEKTHFVLKYSK